jgi:hypothetical protein
MRRVARALAVILNEVKDLAAEGDASEIVTAPITARFFAVLRMT